MILFSVVWLVLFHIDHSKSNFNYRVHEGREVTEGNYPYVIILVGAVEKVYARVCTGSMITETWGLTAAHCNMRSPVRNYYVVYDNFTESPLDSGCYVPIIEMFSHPSYRSLSTHGGTKDLIVNNDIGVFRSESVPKKPYAVLLSVDYSALIGLPVVYVGAGWTKMTPRYDDMTRPLQIGEATIITCDDEMRSISKYVICLAPKCLNRLQRPWYGDSGGPLIYDGKVVGVCSYGVESTNLARAGYAPVSPYTGWIHRVINATGA